MGHRIDPAAVGAVGVLEPETCAEVATRAAALIDVEALGEAFSFRGDSTHRVDHLDGAVTVHVYSPPLRAIGHYELVDGELRRESNAPDEFSPPSAALAKALGDR